MGQRQSHDRAPCGPDTAFCIAPEDVAFVDHAPSSAGEDNYILRQLCQYAALNDADSIRRECGRSGGRAKLFVNTLTKITGLGPLHVAGTMGSSDAAVELLRAGARTDIPSLEGRVAHQYATSAGHHYTAQILSGAMMQHDVPATPHAASPRVQSPPSAQNTHMTAHHYNANIGSSIQAANTNNAFFLDVPAYIAPRVNATPVRPTGVYAVEIPSSVSRPILRPYSPSFHTPHRHVATPRHGLHSACQGLETSAWFAASTSRASPPPMGTPRLASDFLAGRPAQETALPGRPAQETALPGRPAQETALPPHSPPTHTPGHNPPYHLRHQLLATTPASTGHPQPRHVSLAPSGRPAAMETSPSSSLAHLPAFGMGALSPSPSPPPRPTVPRLNIAAAASPGGRPPAHPAIPAHVYSPSNGASLALRSPMARLDANSKTDITSEYHGASLQGYGDEENQHCWPGLGKKRGTPSKREAEGRRREAEDRERAEAGRREMDVMRHLVVAASSDDGEAIRRLCSTPLGQTVLNRLNPDGLAPIHIAAHLGNLYAFSALAESGAEMRYVSSENKTAEDYARDARHPDIFRIMELEDFRRSRLKSKAQMVNTRRGSKSSLMASVPSTPRGGATERSGALTARGEDATPGRHPSTPRSMAGSVMSTGSGKSSKAESAKLSKAAGGSMAARARARMSGMFGGRRAKTGGVAV